MTWSVERRFGEMDTDANQMCLLLTPQFSVGLSLSNNSHCITRTNDEYIEVGVHRVTKRGVIQLNLSEYFLPKSTFGVVDAGILERVCQPNLRHVRQNFR